MTLGVCAQTDSVSVYDTPDSDGIVADASVSDALQPEKKKGCWFGRTCKNVFGFFTAEPDNSITSQLWLRQPLPTTISR